MPKISREEIRKTRAFHIRKKIFGTAERPRLSVYRSNSNIFAQIIDDAAQKTLCAASSYEKDFVTAGKKKADISREVGVLLAKKAVAKGIKSVVFDRNGYLYSGARIKNFADAARENGLEF
ncbi:MAG: 50S ribosomal protein L18 [Chitinispirillales bacterium]|jgi:large subunit ribosomal protein L18|nr:50S ribosomal protein L18 [Chitinispirillales bacterium]